MTHDPTAPRKKYALRKWVRKYNARNPQRRILTPGGFNPDSERVGTPARELLRSMQRAAALPVTGKFDQRTMARLLPPGVRGRVMARAHAELGEHEWPPASNRGAIEEYLAAVGLGGGYAWCAAFVTWDLKHEVPHLRLPANPAYVPSWLEFAKDHGLLKPVSKSLKGDLWIWNWDGGTPDHIGFCDDTNPRDPVAYYLDGNVGAYGGSGTNAARPANGIQACVDLVKLSRLKG